MQDYIDSFLDYIRIERNYSDYTETNYLLDLEKFNTFLNANKLKYKNITYDNVTKYIKFLNNNLNLNPLSINRNLSTLRTFYNYLIKINVVNNNPFKLVKGPKKPLRLPNYMKYKEFNLLIESIDNTNLGIRNRALIELLFASGVRVGELINLKIKDINFKSQELKVLGKGNKERICYFNSYANDALNEYLNKSRPILLKGKTNDYLFINNLGNPLTDRGVRFIIDELIKKSSLNIKVTPHTFRHTFATMLLNEGCDLKCVQELLGHVNLSTTSIYTHITNDRIKDIYLHTHPRSKS